jgi:phospholipase/carboxylesterase
MVSTLNASILKPANGSSPTGQLVLLHGWGANAQDLLSLAPVLNLSTCVICCPDAPLPHPQVPGGRMWYDLESEHRDGLADSRRMLVGWLMELESLTGVPLSRTILAGFSQGGAMTLDVGLQLPLAGLVILSGYLHPNLQVSDRSLSPILVMHGQLDYVVPIQAAHQMLAFLQEHDAPLTYEEFDRGHEIPPIAVAHMQQFIADVLKI